jgi:hypothetical protein
LARCEAVHKGDARAWLVYPRCLDAKEPVSDAPDPPFLRPARLLGLMTPLAVMVGLVVLLLLPNLIMHTGLGSNASSAVSLPGGAASQSAAAAGESPPVMR